jgi:hypothetical protein
MNSDYDTIKAIYKIDRLTGWRTFLEAAGLDPYKKYKDVFEMYKSHPISTDMWVSRNLDAYLDPDVGGVPQLRFCGSHEIVPFEIRLKYCSVHEGTQPHNAKIAYKYAKVGNMIARLQAVYREEKADGMEDRKPYEGDLANNHIMWLDNAINRLREEEVAVANLENRDPDFKSLEKALRGYNGTDASGLFEDGFEF